MSMQSNLSPDNVDDGASASVDGFAFVDANWIVADLLATWPQTTPVFLRHKMNCVGCSMAAFESLGDALHIYNLPQEPFLAEINAVISLAPQA
jgi:hybrid cluster-associated redox disulfide protein